MKDFFELPVRQATVLKAVQVGADILQPVVQDIGQAVVDSAVAHAAETGVMVAKKLHWLHVLATGTLTWMGCHPKRGGGFVMVLLSAMQSGVTDNLINELRLSLGVARRTLQRWRHWWHEIFVATPFWELGRGHFVPPIEPAALPMSLLDRFTREDV